MFNTTGTALLVIDYRGTSAANSIAGATAALKAIAGAYPVSPNIIPGSVGAVQAPTTASCLERRDRPRGDRRDPRHRTRATADGRVGAGRSEDRPTRGPESGGRVADLARQRDLRVRGECTDCPVEGARRARAVKDRARPGDPRCANGSPEGCAQVQPGPGERRGGALVGPDGRVTSPRAKTSRSRSGSALPAVIACEVPSADLTALQSIMDCDLVVLVARRGTPRAALRELLDSLTEFGVSPKWAIFLGARACRTSRPGRSPMSVSTVRLRDGRRVRASPSAAGAGCELPRRPTGRLGCGPDGHAPSSPWEPAPPSALPLASAPRPPSLPCSESRWSSSSSPAR